jgi:hypothetical protein
MGTETVAWKVEWIMDNSGRIYSQTFEDGNDARRLLEECRKEGFEVWVVNLFNNKTWA